MLFLINKNTFLGLVVAAQTKKTPKAAEARRLVFALITIQEAGRQITTSTHSTMLTDKYP